MLAQSDEVQNTSYQAPFTAVTGVGDFKTASTTTANRFQGFYNNKDVSQQVSPFFSCMWPCSFLFFSFLLVVFVRSTPLCLRCASRADMIK